MPSDEIVQRFINVVDNARGGVAVHCKVCTILESVNRKLRCKQAYLHQIPGRLRSDWNADSLLDDERVWRDSSRINSVVTNLQAWFSNRTSAGVPH